MARDELALARAEDAVVRAEEELPPREAGADEALMLDPTGAVATCNATNFFVVREGGVWTSTGHYNLNGITRQLVLEVAPSAGLTAHEKRSR